MHDVDIRRNLNHLLGEKLNSEASTVIVNELGILQGRVFIDVAVVNDFFYGFEIKSSEDTLERLDRQIVAYSEIVDFASIVAATNHLAEARSKIPKWWGMYSAKTIDSDVKITQLRAPKRNTHVSARALAELLWRDEAVDLLNARNAARGIRNKRRAVVWDRLCQVYELDEIRAIVRAKLKDRAAQKICDREANGAHMSSDGYSFWLRH